MLLLNHTAKVFRKTQVGTGISRKYGDNPVSVIKCLAQPMSDKDAVANGYDIGQAYTVYCDVNSDVKSGDKLEVIGMIMYVQGIKRYVNQPPVSHLELACTSTEGK